MKLKQKVISLSILFTCMFMTGVSAADSQELVIKAYKIARSKQQGITEFVVTDALADFTNLNRITKGERLVVDGQISKFLGTAGDTLDKEAFSEQIVFSVRVAGSGAGNYTVTMKFSPFDYEKTDADNDSTIGVSYQLGNVTSIFEETSTNVIKEQLTTGSTETRKTWSTTTVLPASLVAKPVLNSSYPAEMGFSWRVSPEGGSSTKTPNWTTRAAVAMTIDEDSYRECSQFGEHASTVTVELKVIP